MGLLENAISRHHFLKTAAMSVGFITLMGGLSSCSYLFRDNSLNPAGIPESEPVPRSQEQAKLIELAENTLKISYPDKQFLGVKAEYSVFPFVYTKNQQNFLLIVTGEHVVTLNTCRGDFLLEDDSGPIYDIKNGEYSQPQIDGRAGEVAVMMIPFSSIKILRPDHKLPMYDPLYFQNVKSVSGGVVAGFPLDSMKQGQQKLKIYLSVDTSRIQGSLNQDSLTVKFPKNPDRTDVYYSIREGASGGPLFVWNPELQKPILAGCLHQTDTYGTSAEYDKAYLVPELVEKAYDFLEKWQLSGKDPCK